MKFEKIEARGYNHDASDPREPTAYKVISSEDGQELGTVHSCSSESWRKVGRIRTRLLGYARWWEAKDLDGKRVGYHWWTRHDAAKALAMK